jgi:glycosyltransferase involved in cell wall biosynthesis
MAPRTVLYVDHCVQLSGAELSLLALVTGLDKSRFRPVIVLPEDGPLASAAAEHGIPVRLVPVAGQLLGVSRGFAAAHPIRTAATLAHAVRPVRELRRIIDEEGAAVVHSNSIKAHVLAAAAVRGTSARLVWHVRNILGTGMVERTLLWGARRWPDRVVTISEAVRESVLRRNGSGDNVVTIYNGIAVEAARSAGDTDALRRELGILPKAPLVCLIGQIARRKGQREFIEAAAVIVETHPDARFLIVGAVLFPQNEAAYEQEMLARVEQLGLGDNVILAGQRNDVPCILAASDVMVHAATEPEPFGRVLIEAMAAQKPVVATDTGAAGEIVVDLDGKGDAPTGILVPPRDPDAIASAVLRLLDDEALSARLGGAGFERLGRHFTIESTVRQVQQLYSELLDSAGNGS